MKTVREIIELSNNYLDKKEIFQKKELEELIAGVLGESRLNLYLNLERPLNNNELDKIRSALERFSFSEPVSYILEQHSFCDLNLFVDKRVLIPRQETEILANKIIQQLKNKDLSNKIFVDLCCGSGCLGLAIKQAFPALHVVLADISEDALAVAKKNAEINGLKVQFCQGNFLEALDGIKCDFLVCNPPYITEKEYDSLDKSVKNFEPKQALVGGVKGIEFYEKLAKELKKYLATSGVFWLEIGYQQEALVGSILSLWRELIVQFEKDWAGHDRYVMGMLKVT